MASPTEHHNEHKEANKGRQAYAGSVNRFRIARSTSKSSPRLSSSRQGKLGQYANKQDSLHTSPGSPASLSSCERCRRQKKKCSRNQPQCDQCLRGSVECQYPELSAVAKLEEKVKQLTKLVQAGSTAQPQSNTLVLGDDTRDGYQTDENKPEDGLNTTRSHHEERSSPNLTVPGGVGEEDTGNSSLAASICYEPTTISLNNSSMDQGLVQSSGQATGSQASSRNVPPDAACNRFVDAYFRHVHHVYPFINKTSVMERLSSIDDDLGQCERDPDSKKLYLIMAIGCTTLERAGQVPRETCMRFRISYADIIDRCLASRNTQSVEVLFLLSLYSLFDPSGMSPWSLVGILTRQAMAVGITRKLPEHARTGAKEGSSSSSISSVYQAELRNRLYWSVFVFDRMVSSCLGMPFGLSDPSSDIPLPSITIEEMSAGPAAATGFKSSLQICRHVIQLRQLEESILNSVHLMPGNPTTSLLSSSPSLLSSYYPLNSPIKESIRKDLRRRIDDWYSQGCLLSATDSDKLSFHNTVTWLTSRYYSLLILLYHSPSDEGQLHLDVQEQRQQRQQHSEELQGWVHRYLHNIGILQRHRQLPLNWVTLYRFLSIFSILLNCHHYQASRRRVREVATSTTFTITREDIMICAETLEAFPATWVVAHRAAGLFRQFAALLLVEGSSGDDISGGGSSGGGGSVLGPDLRQKWLLEIRSGVLELIQENLGWNSVFCLPPEKEQQNQEGQTRDENPTGTNNSGGCSTTTADVPWPLDTVQIPSGGNHVTPGNLMGTITTPLAALDANEHHLIARTGNPPDAASADSWGNDMTREQQPWEFNMQYF